MQKTEFPSPLFLPYLGLYIGDSLWEDSSSFFPINMLMGGRAIRRLSRGLPSFAQEREKLLLFYAPNNFKGNMQVELKSFRCI